MGHLESDRNDVQRTRYNESNAPNDSCARPASPRLHHDCLSRWPYRETPSSHQRLAHHTLQPPAPPSRVSAIESLEPFGRVEASLLPPRSALPIWNLDRRTARTKPSPNSQGVFKNGSRRREEADFGAEKHSASLPRRLRHLRGFLNSPCPIPEIEFYRSDIMDKVCPKTQCALAASEE